MNICAKTGENGMSRPSFLLSRPLRTHEILLPAFGPFLSSYSFRFCFFERRIGIESPTSGADFVTAAAFAADEAAAAADCVHPIPTLPTPSPETGLAPTSHDPIPSLPITRIFCVFLPFAIAR